MTQVPEMVQADFEGHAAGLSAKSYGILKRCRLSVLTFHSILNMSEALHYIGVRCLWKGDQQHFSPLNCGISHHLLRFY